jgi:hypothetical protein
MKNILFLLLFSGTLVAHSQDTIVSKNNQSNKVLDSISTATVKKLPYFTEHKRDGFHFDNGTIMRMPAFAKFLDSEGLGYIWDQYSSGQKTLNTGRGLLVGGLVCNVIGGAVMLTSLGQEEDNKKTTLTSGATVLLIGVVLDIVSIPLIIKGKNKTSDAMNQYNTYAKQQRQETSQVILRFGSTSAGVGLTVDF